MKKLLLACFIFLSFSLSAQVVGISQWVLKHGDQTPELPGVYGTQGVPGVNNRPGARIGSVSWKDNSGNLWLFGGKGYTANSPNYLNELWKYDPLTNQWAWMQGGYSSYGIYGSKGTAATINRPGARYASSSWTDGAGNFWLYGGYGYTASGGTGRLNDLWYYNTSTNLWTWMTGDSSLNVYGNYGSIGVPSSNNKPGSRVDATCWIDQTGNLCLFGGEGYAASTGGYHLLNDLWKFDIGTGDWIWINGDSTVDNIAVYGIQGIAASANKPSARSVSISWVESDGNLCLFGGFGYAASSGRGYLNDLWKYDPLTNKWMWVKGDSIINPISVYGTQGISSATNKPSGRDYCYKWKDNLGNFWLYGGYGHSYSTCCFGGLSDLWRYKPNTNEWTWMKGDTLLDGQVNYGIVGVPDVNNRPGSRESGVSWTDNSGNFWLFGGISTDFNDNAGDQDYFNDLWKLGTITCGNGFTWIGVTDTNWTVGSNWCCDAVPGINDDAIIPSGTPYNAIVPNGVTVSCRSLTIQTGAIVNVGFSAHIKVTH